ALRLRARDYARSAPAAAPQRTARTGRRPRREERHGGRGRPVPEVARGGGEGKRRAEVLGEDDLRSSSLGGHRGTEFRRPTPGHAASVAVRGNKNDGQFCSIFRPVALVKRTC